MKKFPSVVEAYLGDLPQIRASGGATGERWGYGPLANLINEIGGGLRPKVFCVGELADQRAGASRRSPLTGSEVWRSWPSASTQQARPTWT